MRITTKFVGPLLLVLCAMLWGTGFVAQKLGASCMGPFAVLSFRSIFAAAFLFLLDKSIRGKGFGKAEIVGGTIAGFALCVASLAQQIGVIDTTPGVAAFLTTNYILIVPLMAAFVGRKVGMLSWVGVVIAIVGSYLICISGGEGLKSIGRGEICVLVCAVLFAVQILLVDKYAPGTDVIAFSCVQQLVCIVLPIPFFLMQSESIHFNLADMKAAFLPIAYLGIVSSGIAYTLQNLGQVKTPPTAAAVIMSLEAVFGALSGYLFFGDILTIRQFAGCILVFSAAVISQIRPNN